MASAASWSYYAGLFSDAGYDVLLHDFRGQLLSGKPPGIYSFARHAEDALSLFNRLGISHPHIVGTSYGGEAAMRLAADYPEVPATVSIIDSVSETDDVLEGFIGNWIRLAEEGDPDRFFWGMVPTVYSSRFIRENRSFLEERALRFREVPDDYFTGQISLYRTFLADVEMSGILHNIRCAALVVCGGLDILKPLPFSLKIAEAVPGAELIVVPDAGHALFAEKQELLAALLLGFIIRKDLHSPR